MLALAAFAAAGGAQFGSRDGEVWRYPVDESRVVDGDTIQVRVQMGFGLDRGIRIRLEGLDTAETRGGSAELKAHGEAAKRYVEAWIEMCRQPIAIVTGEDKYGRSIGDLECGDDLLGADLLRERLAVAYDGGDRDRLQDLHHANAEWRRKNR